MKENEAAVILHIHVPNVKAVYETWWKATNAVCDLHGLILTPLGRNQRQAVIDVDRRSESKTLKGRSRYIGRFSVA